MPQPLFSIVLPTYNRAHTVTRAIRSCAEQTCQDFEIIIVDDEKSTDDIETAIAPFADLRIRLVTSHRGRAAAARNTGIRLAQGRYVAFLDADDAFLPEKLSLCRQRLQESPQALIYSQTYVDRGVGRLWIKPSRGLRENENIFDYLFVEKGWVHPSTVVVNAVLAKNSPFNEDLSFGDDTQFTIDLWRHGVKIIMIEQPLAIYEDLHQPDRLSQSPVFQPGDSPEHMSFIQWVEARRSHMSERAYLAYQAFYLSRFTARAAPVRALMYIWDGYRRGSLGGPTCLRQIIQTFAPGMYRRCADFMARCRGDKPPASCAAVWETQSV